jgi:hypothetical protein
MYDILEKDLMTSLDFIQTKITDIVSDYKIDSSVEIACVRCSGSAGRYVYENIETKEGNKQ